MRYEFEYDEIACCGDCPLLYDHISCEIDDGERRWGDYTREPDEGRPAWCPLMEVGETCEDVSTTHGVFKCSECGCTVDEEGVDWGGVNHCPDCGKRVER